MDLHDFSPVDLHDLHEVSVVSAGNGPSWRFYAPDEIPEPASTKLWTVLDHEEQVAFSEWSFVRKELIREKCRLVNAVNAKLSEVQQTKSDGLMAKAAKIMKAARALKLELANLRSNEDIRHEASTVQC